VRTVSSERALTDDKLAVSETSPAGVYQERKQCFSAG